MIPKACFCRITKPKNGPGARAYIYDRVIKLRHGCLCSIKLTYWTIKRIAFALDIPESTVTTVLRRWHDRRAIKLLDLRKFNRKPKKLSEDEIKRITSQATLKV